MINIVFVSIGEERTGLGEKLVFYADVLSRRFHSENIAVLESPEFASVELLSDAVSTETLKRVVYSGIGDYTLSDGLVAAKTLDWSYCYLVDINSTKLSLAQLIRFIIYNESNVSQVSEQSRMCFVHLNIENVPSTVFYVKNRRAFGLLFNGFDLEGKTVNTRFENSVSQHKKKHLFVSYNAIRRFGGWREFSRLPFIFGGKSSREFNSFWLLDLDNTNSVEKKSVLSYKGFPVKEVPAFPLRTVKSSHVVCDIAPASPFFGDNSGNPTRGISINNNWNLPRQTLAIRKIDHISMNVIYDKPIVYVVSNFNKSHYIIPTLYSIVSQLHSKIEIEFMDDKSSDDSFVRFNEFRSQVKTDDIKLNLSVTEQNRGTYYIRNKIIRKRIDDALAFFINDSDDYSSPLRTHIQLSLLFDKSTRLACIGDIQRVDSQYNRIPVGGYWERYGTASLAITPKVVKEYGFFQVLRKNADTEFIKRVRKFAPKDAWTRFRFPIMYQVYDGQNLTSDLYGTEGLGQSEPQTNLRELHRSIFCDQHCQLKKSDLPFVFAFPDAKLPSEYTQLGDSFLVDGFYERPKKMPKVMKSPNSVFSARVSIRDPDILDPNFWKSIDTLDDQVLGKLKDLSDSFWKDKREDLKYTRKKAAVEAVYLLQRKIRSSKDNEEYSNSLLFLYKFYFRLQKYADIITLYKMRSIESIDWSIIKYFENYYVAVAYWKSGEEEKAKSKFLELPRKIRPSMKKVVNNFFEKQRSGSKVSLSIEKNYNEINKSLKDACDTLEVSVVSNAVLSILERFNGIRSTRIETLPIEDISRRLSRIICESEWKKNDLSGTALSSYKSFSTNNCEFVFVGGFGWTGSGAIYDYLIDHSDIESLPSKAEVVWLQGRRKLISVYDLLCVDYSPLTFITFVLGGVLGYPVSIHKMDAEDVAYINSKCMYSTSLDMGLSSEVVNKQIIDFLHDFEQQKSFIERSQVLVDFFLRWSRVIANSEKTLLFNNTILGEKFALASFFSNSKFIMVTRDLMDVYCSILYEGSSRVIGTPKNLHERWLRSAENFRHALDCFDSKEDYRIIRFEDFVLDQNVRTGLVKWIGLSPICLDENEPNAKTFDANISKMNIGIHRSFDDQSAIGKLRQLLNEKPVRYL